MYQCSVVPVANLDSKQLREYVLKIIETVQRSGGRPVSIIYDNCPLNQRVYKEFSGPGLVKLPNDGLELYVVYDYVHIFKNLSNNWITETQQELSFNMDGTKIFKKSMIQSIEMYIQLYTQM